jgi:hypothetical protein
MIGLQAGGLALSSFARSRERSDAGLAADAPMP